MTVPLVPLRLDPPRPTAAEAEAALFRRRAAAARRRAAAARRRLRRQRLRRALAWLAGHFWMGRLRPQRPAARRP